MRIHNFSAGPSTLPVEILEALQKDIVDYQGVGYSLIEASHRGKVFDGIYNETMDLLKEIMGIPAGYTPFFLGGGATLQFAMIPMNFQGDGTAYYAKTGTWSNKATDDAQKLGKVVVAFDGKESNYSTLPDPAKLDIPQDASYFYYCSNETIGGIQWQQVPEVGNVPLIVDTSSDFLSRPIDVEKFSLIYGGVQKNLAPAGATLVIVKDEMLERCPANLPAYLSYQTHAKAKGLYNTPPVFSIWAVNLMLKWIKKNGGLVGMQQRAEEKAGLLYDLFDSSSFYRNPVDPAVRSRMNVVFRLPSEELEAQFVAEALKQGLSALKGHKSVGGCRASIYNALEKSSVEALIDFMREFERTHG